MRPSRLPYLALLAFAFACTGTDQLGDVDAGPTGPRECEPACRSWQECDDGTCRPALNRCDADRDCPSHRPVCDLQSHRCAEGTSSGCDSCAAWQVCEGTSCVPGPNRCGSNADCTSGTCNLSTNTCSTASTETCTPKCADWQQCVNRTCSLAPGRCNTDAECTTQEAPVCNTTSHACEAPPVAQPKVLKHAGLIITSETLKASFEWLAELHTLTGIPTRVVTVSEICAAATCSTTDRRKDAAKAVKDYILAQPDVTIVVLGGDVEHVPQRRVYDEFENSLLGVSFAEEFPSDHYYADSSNWDTDGDGLYAEESDAPDLLPERGVTRIPVSTPLEAERYVDKVFAHLTEYDLSRVQTALMLSNVATSFTVPGTTIPIDIDGAVYFVIDGRTESLLPAGYTKTKLYAVPPARVEELTLPREIEELERSHNIVVHNGHGWTGAVTVEMDGEKELSGDIAYSLENTQYPFFLSCACDAGKFSMDDSAGEDLINAPAGGAIGYLGNAATGLGLAGGAQMVDEFLRYTFAVPRAYVGDAIRTAHEKLPLNDTIPVPVPWLGDVNVPVVDEDSWNWTQKGVVYLGDGLVPVWTDGTLAYAPDVTVTKSSVGRYARLRFQFAQPVVNGTLRVLVGANVYELTVNGTDAFLVLASAPARLSWGFQSAKTIAGYGEKTF